MLLVLDGIGDEPSFVLFVGYDEAHLKPLKEAHEEQVLLDLVILVEQVVMVFIPPIMDHLRIHYNKKDRVNEVVIDKKLMQVYNPNLQNNFVLV